MISERKLEKRKAMDNGTSSFIGYVQMDLKFGKLGSGAVLAETGTAPSTPRQRSAAPHDGQSMSRGIHVILARSSSTANTTLEPISLQWSPAGMTAVSPLTTEAKASS